MRRNLPKSRQSNPRSCVLALGSLILMMAVGVNAPASAQDSKRPATASAASIKKLINQLGATKFAERNSAMNQLLGIGLQAWDELQTGTNSDDPEIQARCRLILSQVRHLNRERQIRDFLSTIKPVVLTLPSPGSSQSTIPGWDEFKSISGDTRHHRNFYARMLDRNWDFLAYTYSNSRGPKETWANRGAIVTEFIDRLQNNADANQGITEEELATALFASANSEVTLNNASSLFSLCGRSETRRLILSSQHRTTLLSLMGQVVGRRFDDVAVSSQLYLSVLYGLPNGLSLAKEIVHDRDQRAYVRQNAIVLFAKLGSKDDVQHLMPLLDDRSHAIRIQNIQIRDMALAAMIHMSGEDPKKFGFHEIKYDAVWVFELYSLTMKDDATRAAGIERWRKIASPPTPDT